MLEYQLGAAEGTAWNDNREVVMLAGIKADLLRFEPRGEESGMNALARPVAPG